MLTTEHRARSAPGGKEVAWVIPNSFDIEPFVRDLSVDYVLQPEQAMHRIREWYDTDDWRLYRNEQLLFFENGKWNLVQKDSGKPIATYTGTKTSRFRFAWNFPVSRLRSLLEPVITIRSLLPMLHQESFISCHRVLNKDSKTVALIYFDEHLIPETTTKFRTATLKGIRGYNSSFEALRDFFSTCGIDVEAPFSAPLEHGVQSHGRSPGDYTSKFSIDLKPDMVSRQAMVLIYRQLLESMEHNVQGIIDDIDIEFLHDFRVAIRRTRSGLAQVKGVLPEDILVKAKKDFSWLGSVTGATRDLDVYLLERDQYLQRLPVDLRPYLDYFFADIAAQRKDEQQELVKNIRSKRCRLILQSWHDFLYGDQVYGETKRSGQTISSLAREIIFRKYNKILKDGSAIKRSSPDQDLHRLRIQCKKLRYIFEFFTSLFPPAKVKVAVKQLKRLQDNLGSFNDLSVQQEMLNQYVVGIKPGSKKNQHLATAIGGLLTTLYHEQQKIRQGFYARFKQFSSEENQQLYTQLFH